MTKQEAISIILNDTPHYGTSLNYAVNYCKEAKFMSGYELNIQCLYIVENIKGWRHPQAKEIRETLRRKE